MPAYRLLWFCCLLVALVATRENTPAQVAVPDTHSVMAPVPLRFGQDVPVHAPAVREMPIFADFSDSITCPNDSASPGIYHLPCHNGLGKVGLVSFHRSSRFNRTLPLYMLFSSYII